MIPMELTSSQRLLYELIKRLDVADDKVKLAKLAYFADFIHYAFHDKPISEATNLYEKQKFGPLSLNFNADLARLQELGLIKSPKKFHFVVAKDLDTDFKRDEEKTIQYVLDKYKGYSYDLLSDISHKQIPYMSALVGGIINYNTAYNLVDEYSDYAV